MQTGYSYQPVGPGPDPLQPPRDESLPELSAHNSSAWGRLWFPETTPSREELPQN